MGPITGEFGNSLKTKTKTEQVCSVWGPETSLLLVLTTRDHQGLRGLQGLAKCTMWLQRLIWGKFHGGICLYLCTSSFAPGLQNINWNPFVLKFEICIIWFLWGSLIVGARLKIEVFKVRLGLHITGNFCSLAGNSGRSVGISVPSGPHWLWKHKTN